MSHLTEETLNEYLDNALTPAARADVDAHLAACDTCTAELESLRTLFAQIGSLPEATLERNLTPIVVARLPVRVGMSRPLGWALAAQGLVALVLLAALLPFADFSSLNLPTLTPDLFILPTLPTLSSLFTQITVTLPSLSLPIDMPTLLLVPLLASVGLLWLVGNGLLLLFPRATSLKRRSL